MANVEEEAVELAKKHYAVEEGLKDIFVLNEVVEVEVVRGGETVKLLEVNENTVPAGVAPIQFGPAPSSGIHYPSVIVEVTPAEFEQIKANKLPLPNGWQLGDRVPKPAE
jgi:hypothetical protein